jgi:hypothetical protein
MEGMRNVKNQKEYSDSDKEYTTEYLQLTDFKADTGKYKVIKEKSGGGVVIQVSDIEIAVTIAKDASLKDGSYEISVHDDTGKRVYPPK